MGKYQAGGLYGTNTQSLFRTYEPLNLKAHVPEAAKILRERYDTAVEEKSLLDRAMGSIRTISDADAAKVNVAKYDINNNIIGDRVDYENMGKTIKDAATRLLTDHSIMRAQDSFANYQKELEENAALTRQGIKILDFNQIPVKDEKGKIQKDSLGNPLMQHVSKTWDSDVNGVYQRGSQAKLDWDAQAQQLIQGIAADSGPIREALVDAGISPKEAEAWLSAGEGVSKDKVKRIAQALKPVFLQTQEGMQMFNYLTRLEIDPKEGDLHRPEVAEKKIEDFLYNIGLKQAGWTNRYMQSAIDRSAGEDQMPYAQSFLEVHANIPDSPLSKITETKTLSDLFDTRGNFKEAESIRKEPKLSVRIKEMEKTILDEKTDWSKFTETDFARLALSDNAFTKQVPRKQGETDKNYTLRLAKIVRNRPIAQEIYPTSSPDAASLAMKGWTNGVLYQESGNPYKDQQQYLNDVQGWGLSYNRENTVRSALEKSIEGEMTGKTVDGQPAGVTTMITSGENAGRLRHTYYVDGEKKSMIISPVAKMEKQFQVIRAMSNGTRSLNPSYYNKVESDIFGTIEIKNRLSKDGESIETYILDDGYEIDPESASAYNLAAILKVYGASGTQLQKAFTFQKTKNERGN